MTPFWEMVVGFFTLAVMLAFIGIWAWAWLPQHKGDFDALAKLPLQDGEEAR
jgi:cytochrome c oxidase cbb3-type subunit 4